MMSQQQFQAPQQSQPAEQQRPPLTLSPVTMSPHLSLRKTAGVVILLSSLIMIFFAISAFIYLLVASKSASLFALSECLYLVIQSCVGVYATLFRSQQVLVAFVILCLFNFVFLTTVLLVDSSNQLILKGSASSPNRAQHSPERCDQLLDLTMPMAAGNVETFEKVIADCWAAIMKQDEACIHKVRRLHGLSSATCCSGRELLCKLRLLSLKSSIMNVDAKSALPDDVSDEEAILARLEGLRKKLNLELPPPSPPPPTSKPKPPAVDERTDKPMSAEEVLARIIFWHLATYNIFIAIVASCLIAFDTDKPHHRSVSQSKSLPRPSTYLQSYPRNSCPHQHQLELMRAPQPDSHPHPPPPPPSTVLTDQQQPIQPTQQFYFDYIPPQQQAAVPPPPSSIGQPVELSVPPRAPKSPIKSPRSPLRLTKTPRSPSARRQKQLRQQKQLVPKTIKSDRIC